VLGLWLNSQFHSRQHQQELSFHFLKRLAYRRLLPFKVTTQSAIEIAPQGRSAAAPTFVGASACAD
jgi:hypothetical protein